MAKKDHEERAALKTPNLSDQTSDQTKNDDLSSDTMIWFPTAVNCNVM